jgi:hypothetical protein
MENDEDDVNDDGIICIFHILAYCEDGFVNRASWVPISEM